MERLDSDHEGADVVNGFVTVWPRQDLIISAVSLFDLHVLLRLLFRDVSQRTEDRTVS